jgi:ribosome maturation factor RimP
MSGRKPTFSLQQKYVAVQTSRKAESQRKMALALEKIRATADRVAESHGLEIVELEYSGGSHGRVLCGFLEKNAEGRAHLKEQIASGQGEDLPERFTRGEINMNQLSGVTHEDCEVFSRDFGTVLDVEELIPVDSYTLEVSSPGLDRKLSKREDFVRFSGTLVKVETDEPIEGNRFWQGRLSAVSETAITLDLSATKQKGKAKKLKRQEVVIELPNIAKAQLIPEV